MQSINAVVFYPNGTVSAFDCEGQHVEEFNTPSWIELYCEWLESQGHFEQAP